MFAPEGDFISNMPDIVVTNILDRLPIRDAVRTGILSRNWRLKWTMLLSQLLKGAIKKCFLHVSDGIFYGCVKDASISHVILFLFRKGIQDLTIKNQNFAPLKLPTHLFSCLELKHLDVDFCRFYPPPGFHGFPNLLSLHLGGETSELGEFLTRCPLLKTLYLHPLVKVNLIDIAKRKNLKVLSLALGSLGTTAFISVDDIFELLGSLPKLQELNLDFLATSNFPNLQTVEIVATRYPEAASPSHVNYNTTRLLQLQSVTFEYFKGSENELCFIKYLLACSPFLKRMVVHHHMLLSLSFEEKFMFARKLLKLHRASPVVDIDLS
ncbi:F-box/FBD/LRR-repeat protein At5g22700-like [Bidens hawaiensis]|uniref:F-box/FBD/LRR-repeat protein At5g22700-like n=1 Tax=Bidens hawaiensis TaxID=980011 RepID=UPI00404B28B8